MIKRNVLNQLGANFTFYLGRVLSKIGKRTNTKRTYIQAGEVACYSQAIRLDPTFTKSKPQVYYYQGEVLFALKCFDEAIIMFRQAVELSPNSPWYNYNLGKALLACRRLTEASMVFQRTIKLDPAFFWAYYNLGIIFQNQNQFEQAISCFQQTIALNPEFVWAHFNRMRLLLELERFEETISVSHYAIKVIPDAYEPYLNLGEALTQQNQFSEAIASFRTASQKQTAKSHPHFSMTAVDPKGSNPNFIVIGQAKCGTTFFYRHLTQHPQILPAIKKEIRFWERDFDHGLEWYQAHFPAISEKQDFITGEASPQYLDYEEAASRLSQVYPDTNLIILLRNPIQMVFSLYHMRFKKGADKRPWEEVVTTELGSPLLTSSTPTQAQKIASTYLNKGLYLDSIKRWMALFPKNQILVLDSARLFADPTATFNQVFQFLGVRPHQFRVYTKENVGYYPPMDIKLQCKLAEFFKPHNEQLQAFLDLNFNWD